MVLVPYEHNLAVIHREENAVKANRHQSVKLYRFPRSLKVSHQHSLVNEFFLFQIKESVQERLRCRECRYIDIRLASLFQYPAYETESVQSRTQVRLCLPVSERH